MIEMFYCACFSIIINCRIWFTVWRRKNMRHQWDWRQPKQFKLEHRSLFVQIAAQGKLFRLGHTTHWLYNQFVWANFLKTKRFFHVSQNSVQMIQTVCLASLASMTGLALFEFNSYIFKTYFHSEAYLRTCIFFTESSSSCIPFAAVKYTKVKK